jgi:hypothetical protein
MKQPAFLSSFFRAARLVPLAAAVLAAVPCRAADVSQRHHKMENRFLFVIETTSAMRSRTNGVEDAVLGLLKSGIRGELRNGDTIGLWSYNDQLHTEFPMQVWSVDHTNETVDTVQKYLRHLRYGKWQKLEKAWTAVSAVAAKSERLTVIFINDGEERFHGTPFDVDLDDLQKQYQREFRSKHVPFVTVLAAENGEFFDYSINYPSSITVPHTADPLPPPTPTNLPPVVTAVATNIPPPPEPKPARHIEIVMHGTRAVPQAPSPTNAPAPVSTPSAAADTNVVAQTPTGAAPAKPSKPTPMPSPSPQTNVPVAARVTTTNLTPAPASAPAPPAAVPHMEPPPVATVASAPRPAPIPLTAVSQPKPPPAPTSPMPVTIAPGGQQAALFVIASSLLTIAVVLVVFLFRRSRAQAQPSLISQSIDRSR